MKRKRQKVILIILLVASLVACGAPKGLIEPGKTTTPNTAQPTQSAAPTIKPTRAPIELRQEDGVASFSLTAEDFVTRFNEQWKAAGGEGKLTDTGTWETRSDDAAQLPEGMTCILARLDEENVLSPVMALYLSEVGDVCQIEVMFDDHGFQEMLYEEFDRMCRCASAVFWRDADEETLRALNLWCEETAAETYFGSQIGFFDAQRPKIAHAAVLDNIVVYGYFGAGTLNFCIVPAVQSVQDALTGEGTTWKEENNDN